MTRMQKEMQERISREQLDQAFDARFPEEMRTKLRNARVFNGSFQACAVFCFPHPEYSAQDHRIRTADTSLPPH